MNATRLLIAVTLGAISLAGCDDQKPKQNAATTEPSAKEMTVLKEKAAEEAPSQKKATKVLEATSKQTEVVRADVENAVKKPVSDATKSADNLASQLQTKSASSLVGNNTETPEIHLAKPDTSMAHGLSGSADDVVAKAESLIQQVRQYIDGENLDLAQRGLTELEKLKEMLPLPLQQQIPHLQELLKTAKGMAEKTKDLPFMK